MKISNSSQTNPIEIFTDWFNAAREDDAVQDHTAMFLATSSKDLMPTGRVVLLKKYDERGFCFFTDSRSKKGVNLKENPKASICFYWPSLARQIRIEGLIEEVSKEDADAYFASRHIESQVSANCSFQSHEMKSREDFVKAIETLETQIKSGEKTLTRPEYWKGYRILPLYIEFWEEGKFRRHYRNVFTRDKVLSQWAVKTLYP